MRGARFAIAVAALVAASRIVGVQAAWATTAVPYTDSTAKGYIGLCNASGQQITSGSVNAAPFVYRAVSSQAAPSAYSASSRTATLFGFVAMHELPPGDWGGEQLTASTRYSNPSAPMAQFTGGDEPLSALISDYPPEWDGFYELRMFLGAADQEPYEVSYPVLNIQVQGATWHAVGGGPVDCRAGQAISTESLLLPKSRTSPTSTGASAPDGGSAAAPGRRGAGRAAGGMTARERPSASSSTTGDRAEAGALPAPPSRESSAIPKASPSSGRVLGVVIGGLLVLAGGISYVVVRRRGRTATSVDRSVKST